MIRIEFTEGEFRELLEMCYLADWMANAHKVAGEGEMLFRNMDQKLLSRAKEAGCGDLVDYDEEGKEYFPSRALEEGRCSEVIDESENNAVWDSLPGRLAMRDIEREKGKGALEKMTGEERLRIIREKEEKYMNEFEEHGISRLEIVERKT